MNFTSTDKYINIIQSLFTASKVVVLQTINGYK